MKLRLFIILILLNFLNSVSVYGASLGTYRIYLDNDNRSQKFPVRNRSDKAEECEVGFKYLAYSGNGYEETVKLSEKEQAERSQPVIERIRFSPQKFVLEPKSIQYIAFSLRRKVGEKPNEIRTYATVTCIDVNKKSSMGLITALELTVPLVVRTGNSESLDASLELEKLPKNKVRLKLKGKRSVYGDIKLIKENSDEFLVIENNTVIYPEMSFRDYQLPEITDDNVSIQFVEKGKFANNKTFTFSL